jgi:ankyrin repeat protein
VTRRLREVGESPDSWHDGTTLLHVTAAAGRRRLVEELLKLGATPHARDRRGRTPLLCASEHGCERVVATLAKHDPTFDVNDQDDSGASALIIAARLGHFRLVRWLCERHELRPNDCDRYGVTALHKATSFGQTQCVGALLADQRVQIDQAVSQPSVPDSFEALSGGETALHLACSHTYRFNHTQHTRIAKMLLAAGANPNKITSRGRTAVHCAVAAGNIAILRELVSCGRVHSWNARDADGKTAADLALHGDPALAVLLAHGATEASVATDTHSGLA